MFNEYIVDIIFILFYNGLFLLYSLYLFYILILDFERHDDDELGFRKNDIITIISRKDEHCWVGELNSLRGKLIKNNIISAKIILELILFC